jgi:hypothetical protein
MGIASLGGLLSGAGDVESADTGETKQDFRRLLRGYLGSAQGLYDTEAQFKPQFLQLDLQQFSNALQGLQPQLSGANTSSRSANIGDLSTLGPAALSAYRNLNPDGGRLMTSLNANAQAGLEAGNRIAPNDISNITSSVRGDWASRGLGTSAPGQLDEAVNLATAGENLRSNRQQFASGVAGLNQNQNAQLLPILQGESNAPAAAGQFLGSAGPTLFNSGQVGDLMSSVYGAKNAANQATAANATSLYQSMDANQTAWGSSLNQTASSL